MILEWDSKIVTESLHAIMALAHPFSAKLAHELRVLLEPEGVDTTTGAFPRLKYGDVPTWLVVFKCVSRCESRETCADDDAGVRATLDVGADEKGNSDRRESRMF
jgi:hypothetical protein